MGASERRPYLQQCSTPRKPALQHSRHSGIPAFADFDHPCGSLLRMRRANLDTSTIRGARSPRRAVATALGAVVTAGAWLAAQAPPSTTTPTFRKVILDGAF